MGYSSSEKEAMGLCICLEALNDIINHQILTVKPMVSPPGESVAIFDSSVHRNLFLIRLLDFVREIGDKKLLGVAGSCLTVLSEACKTKSFSVDGNTENLKDAVDALEQWLHHKRDITLWLPTLDLNATINISRIDFLRITGNYSKHNLSRLSSVSGQIKQIFLEAGYVVDEDLIPLALDDFREHLSENYFQYYATWLTELLNNLRWGLQEYLWPTYLRSYVKDQNDEYLYFYDYPADIQSKIPRQWFWRLMNNIRTGPYFKKFICSSSLKEESSLEWTD